MNQEKFYDLIHELADIAEASGITNYRHFFETDDDGDDVLITITRGNLKVVASDN